MTTRFRWIFERRPGATIETIGEAIGLRPATIGRWLRDGISDALRMDKFTSFTASLDVDAEFLLGNRQTPRTFAAMSRD